MSDDERSATELHELNIAEAAEYLGISESLMQHLYAHPGGPLFLHPPVNADDEDNAVTFQVSELDRLRSRIPALSAGWVDPTA